MACPSESNLAGKGLRQFQLAEGSALLAQACGLLFPTQPLLRPQGEVLEFGDKNILLSLFACVTEDL